METYSVSHDGKLIAFSQIDKRGHSSVWLAPANHRSSLLRLSSSTVEDSPYFLPNGDIVCRAIEGRVNFLYRMKTDGTARRKISSEHMLDLWGVSPMVADYTSEKGRMFRKPDSVVLGSYHNGDLSSLSHVKEVHVRRTRFRGCGKKFRSRMTAAAFILRP